MLAPTANPDSYSVTENQTLTIAAPGVLSNDSDPNNLTPTAVSFTTPQAHGTASARWPTGTGASSTSRPRASTARTALPTRAKETARPRSSARHGDASTVYAPALQLPTPTVNSVTENQTLTIAAPWRLVQLTATRTT